MLSLIYCVDITTLGNCSYRQARIVQQIQKNSNYEIESGVVLLSLLSLIEPTIMSYDMQKDLYYCAGWAWGGWL